MLLLVRLVFLVFCSDLFLRWISFTSFSTALVLALLLSWVDFQSCHCALALAPCCVRFDVSGRSVRTQAFSLPLSWLPVGFLGLRLPTRLLGLGPPVRLLGLRLPVRPPVRLPVRSPVLPLSRLLGGLLKPPVGLLGLWGGLCWSWRLVLPLCLVKGMPWSSLADCVETHSIAHIGLLAAVATQSVPWEDTASIVHAQTTASVAFSSALVAESEAFSWFDCTLLIDTKASALVRVLKANPTSSKSAHGLAVWVDTHSLAIVGLLIATIASSVLSFACGVQTHLAISIVGLLVTPVAESVTNCTCSVQTQKPSVGESSTQHALSELWLDWTLRVATMAVKVRGLSANSTNSRWVHGLVGCDETRLWSGLCSLVGPWLNTGLVCRLIMVFARAVGAFTLYSWAKMATVKNLKKCKTNIL